MNNASFSAIDSTNCKQLVNTDKPFILVLKRGENLAETILHCLSEMNIKSASLSGLGALEDPTIAYYHLDTKTYENKTFSGIYELVSLNGNIAQSEDATLLSHIHVALGNAEHQMIGGHLTNALVGVTVEITVIPFSSPFYRKMNEDIGLKLICSMK